MKNKRRSKGFTLIELIAVLVILAVIALIVTPLVLNIVRKTKDSANKRSVDAYGKSIDLAVASYLLDTGDFPTSVDDLTIEYSGSEVVCGIKHLNEDSSIYLSECSVGGVKVKDSNTDDGWYHYGKTVLYQEYSMGDIVTYNGMEFYVISDSDKFIDSVALLKAEPLSVDEVNTYGAGHVNMYSTSDTSSKYYRTASNVNGYGGMAYYTSPTCGYPIVGTDTLVTTGCTADYDLSEIKYVVDAWASDKLKLSDLKEDNLGYKVRLMTQSEAYNIFNYYNGSNDNSLVKNNYWYWTMGPYNEYNPYHVLNVVNGSFSTANSCYRNYDISVVRPVVTLYKSAL